MSDFLDELFGDGEPNKPPEMPLKDQRENLLFTVALIASMQKNLPIEDILDADISLQSVQGAKVIHLKGRDVINGVERDVDVEFPLNNKTIVSDGRGELFVVVWGTSPLGKYPEVAAAWIAYLAPIYKAGDPSIKPPRDLYSYNPN